MESQAGEYQCVHSVLSQHYLSSSQRSYDVHVEEIEALSAHDLPEIPQFGHEGELRPNLVF